MNPLQHLGAEVPPMPTEARRTGSDVTEAYFDGGNWRAHLRAVAAPQDLHAVEALEGLLDLARAGGLTDLGQAAEHHLRSFRCTSSACCAVRMVVSPSPDDLLFVYDACMGSTCEGPPMWQRAIERWAAQGGREVFDVLALILASPRPPLSAGVRAALQKMQEGADASVHADINRVLGTSVPYRKAGVGTVADGDCLIHALLGAVTENGYRCESDTLRQVRQQLGTLLASQEPGTMPEPIAQVVRGFYEEVQEVRLHVEGSDQPNRTAIERLTGQLEPGDACFDQLAVEAQRAVVHACAHFVAKPGHYLSCSLVPLLAQVSKQAVSLYVEPLGWQHVGSDGQPCQLTREAVAIRFNARRQHYERVENPLQPAEEDDGCVVLDEPRANALPDSPAAAFRRRPSSAAGLSTRMGSTASIGFVPTRPDLAWHPTKAQKPGLAARFLNWVDGIFR